MDDKRKTWLRELEDVLGYRFTDPALLDNALTHRSFVNENLGLALKDNERLEFLGDAVLELTVSDLLMKKFPDHAEGELSKLRASVVNEQPLAELARGFRIGEFLRLGKGEEASQGRMKPSLLANAFESIVAAMYLDGGFDRTAAFVGRLFAPLIAGGARAARYQDYKTAVQEICQIRFHEIPRYLVLSETGPDHDKRFEAGLLLGERVIAKGSGRNKKEAEQKAAQAALEAFNGAEKTELPPGGAPEA
ncbi:MAG: ribonuclease III [Deltaproteobacteria bacterium]|nr:ribonuclease III [Deltaproteobacteria bacterium]